MNNARGRRTTRHAAPHLPTETALLIFTSVLFAGELAQAQLSAAGDDPLKGIRGLYDSIEKIEKEPDPVVVLIDTCDPADVRADLEKSNGLWRLRQLQSRITALSGLDCRLLHYTQATRTGVEKPHVKAIVLRAWKLLRIAPAKEELYALLRETDIPTIGFCGGFHQIYMAFGGKGAEMRRLKPGEKDPDPKYFPGVFKEMGFTNIMIMKHDPIFEGLGDETAMYEQHSCECTELPPEFEVLARSDECAIQTIKHKSKLLYGTQFHPEVYDNDHPDGKRLLQNFFKLAGATGTLHK